ncbi:UNVERIFIED_CONTAM: hypothetical protein Sangu_1454300 [Sesamum angustifolium]|uniref:Aminotransferase-like plant mobile domain-containing protein n=1 Tax=Sesamum angustifolium TaxID=2727405 RepID=A0AAW2N704_9LAMI
MQHGMVIFDLPENSSILKDIGSGLRMLSRCGDRLRHLKIYDVVYASLFTYDHNSNIVKAFCEAWCPLTNTLLISVEELSISLWDLHEPAGLPMTGCLYDKVVPSALKLIGIDEKGERFIPRPRKYLLYTYHLLQSFDDNGYSHKKTIQSKSTHNPLGDIAIQERWSTAEETLFAKLYIEKSLKKEAYLAAYLACWLCAFVLPNKDVNSVHPSTFKMASLMASGRRVNLAIPVLASTYEGLNTVATSPKPARTSPFSYSLRLCITTWFPYLPTNAKKLCSEAYKAWWAKVHGTFHDDNIACLISPKSIKIILKRKKNEDKQVDGGENNSPHALVPFVVVKCNSQAAVAEASKEKGTNESASQSSMADFVAELENEIQSIDAGKESETSHSSTTTPPLGLGLKRKQSPHPATVSVFEGESFLFNHKKEFLLRLWSDLLIKILNTLIDFFSSIESMKSFHKFDILKLEESLNTFFVKVGAYDEARSLSSEKLCQSLHDQQLKEAKDCLQDVQAKASEEAAKVQSTLDELEHIEKDTVALKE